MHSQRRTSCKRMHAVQVSGTVTLPEVPPPAEAAVGAGVAAARGVQPPPDQQMGQLQGQAVADVPEERGQQQLQGQGVSDPAEQPAPQQQQGPMQGVEGAFERRWEQLGGGTQGQGRAPGADTLEPLQRQSADALESPRRQALAVALKPPPLSSAQGQWQAASNFQVPLQRQQSAGQPRKVSTDGSGRPPKSPTVSGLQSPPRCAAQLQPEVLTRGQQSGEPREARACLPICAACPFVQGRRASVHPIRLCPLAVVCSFQLLRSVQAPLP